MVCFLICWLFDCSVCGGFCGALLVECYWLV